MGNRLSLLISSVIMLWAYIVQYIMTEKPSNKQIEARNSLPDELKPIFDDFVADYKYAATLRHDRPYVSYIVIADLIRAGWRLSAKPIK